MRANFYLVTRDLHLYAGLFLSPFVLVFAISVVLLNHPGIPLGKAVELPPVTLHVDLPPGIEKLEGLERVKAVRQVLQKSGITGEIGFISQNAERHRIAFPVTRPGYEAQVEVALDTQIATISQSRTGLWDAFIFLHKMPGPHLANIRRNWNVTRYWGWMVDGTVWILMFLTVSGFYLWIILKSERTPGLIMITGGAVALLGALYALCG